MLRLVGTNIPDDVDIFTGLKMVKGLDTPNSSSHKGSKIERLLTKAGLTIQKRDHLGRLVKDYPKVANLTWAEKKRLIEIVEMPRAVLRHARISPRKLRLVADAVRGKPVDQALAILEFMPKAGAPILLKLLKSAIANAGQNHDLKANDLFIAKLLIDGGPTMRRFMARARGRACRIRKRTAHAKIVLREKNAGAALKSEAKAKAKAAAKEGSK